MPKISDIEETPNPNAVKFILREAVSNGTAHQYGSADQAQDDPLAKSLFDVGHVVSVFYMDRMITVEKDDEGDWDDLLPTLAVPIRAAEAVNASQSAAAAAVGGAIAAATSDDPRLLKINDILDEKVRPALMGDGGYLEMLGFEGTHLEHPLSGRMWQLPKFAHRNVDGDRRNAETGSGSGTGSHCCVRKSCSSCRSRSLTTVSCISCISCI